MLPEVPDHDGEVAAGRSSILNLELAVSSNRVENREKSQTEWQWKYEQFNKKKSNRA